MSRHGLGHGYGQLQSISLEGCKEVTDSGVIALSHECDQLQIINLSYCRKVTDAGVIALGLNHPKSKAKI